MNKIKYIYFIFTILILNIILSNNVFAESSLKIICNKTTLNVRSSTNCSVILNTTESSIKSIDFAINSHILTFDTVSDKCASVLSSSNGAGYQDCNNLTNNTAIATFSISIPATFMTGTYPITAEYVSIKTQSGANDMTASSYETKIKVNGTSGGSGTPSAKLYLDCPYYYVGKSTQCKVMANINNNIFNTISFKFPVSQGTFKMNSSIAGSYSLGDWNNDYYVSLSAKKDQLYFGKINLGTFTFTPKAGTNTLTFNEVQFSTVVYVATNSYIISNKVENVVSLGTVKINYTGTEIPKTLKTIKINGSVIQGFNSDTYNYDLTLNNVSSAKIEAATNDPDGKVTGTGTFTLKEGLNTFKLVSKPSVGGTVTYTLNITYHDTRSKVNTLSSLSLDKATINFDPNTTQYQAEVPFTTTKLTIKSTLTDPKSKYVKDYGNRTVNLKPGNNVISVKVQAENGVVREYKITVNRIDNRSSTNTLSSLELSTGTINFNSNTTSYSINVNKDVNQIKITSTLTDPKSKYVKNYGNRTVKLKPGKNTIQVKVQAENESVRTYTITVHKEDNRSSVNTLKTLTISDAKIDFKPETNNYTIVLPQTITKVTINSTLTDSKSKYVKDFGNRTVNLNTDITTIQVKVQAENESIRTYTITVNRTGNSNYLDDISIKQIEANGQILTVHTDGKYYVTINKNQSKMDVSITLNNPNATYTIKGNEDLYDGKQIVIHVTSENKAKFTDYLLIVNEEKNKEEEKEQTTNTSMQFIFIALGILIIAALATLFVFKSK